MEIEIYENVRKITFTGDDTLIVLMQKDKHSKTIIRKHVDINNKSFTLEHGKLKVKDL